MNFHKIANRSEIVVLESNYDKSWEKLTPGFYRIFDSGGFSQSVLTFDPIEEKDNLIKFSSGIAKDVLEYISFFFNKITIQKFKELKMIHKMGLLLYGPPGTGKTCLNQLIMQEMVSKYEAICLDCTDCSLKFTLRIISKLREFQDNPIVIFVDEFEGVANKQEYLPFLDGTNSVNKLLFLGCTNFIDKIPPRIRDRKSRVKKCFEVKSLPFEVYKEYLEQKLPKVDTKVIFEFATKAEEMSLTIDQLKNAVIDYYIDGYSIEEALDEAKQLVDITHSEED